MGTIYYSSGVLFFVLINYCVLLFISFIVIGLCLYIDHKQSDLRFPKYISKLRNIMMIEFKS